MPHKAQAFNNLLIRGELAYAAVDYCGLEIIDISDPANITQQAWLNPWYCNKLTNLWFNSAGHTNQIELDPAGRRVYLSAGDSELITVDVSNPAAPLILNTLGARKDGLGAWGIHTNSGLSFLTYIRTPIPFKGTWSGIKAYRHH